MPITDQAAASERRNSDLATAIADARARYVARNPQSRLRHEAACAVMPGGNTRSILFHGPFPLTITGGRGSGITDADGHDYVDFLGEFTAGLFGHSHPAIRVAITKALDGGINLSGHNHVEAEFARAVCERFPSIERIRFTNSGTEANLMAVATACSVTGRSKLMAFRGGYHGGLLSFGEKPSPINAPYEIVLGDYNDVPGLERLLAEHGDGLAAIIAEPMLGAGGCIPADADFLQALRAGADRHGALLVLDEVMTSRLAPGGLQQARGIRPDLTTLGKYIGGGMSFGAFGGRTELLDLYDPRRTGAFQHAGTFNNNILTMSAGLAAMTEIFTVEAGQRLNALGDRLRERLNALAKSRGLPLQFTGIGSLMTAHFSATPVRTPRDAWAGDAGLKELLFFDLLEHGHYLARRGMIALSLEITEAECDALVASVDEFLTLRAPLMPRQDG